MIHDSTHLFVPTSGQSLIVGASTPSTNIVDLAGVGSGVAPNAIFGNASVFGADMGVGDGPMNMKAWMVVGTAFVTANSATLNAALQGAIDNGSNAPGAWQTYGETGALTAAQLVANTPFDLSLARAFPQGTLPRFLRLLWQLPAGTSFTAGTIAWASLISTRDSYIARYYPSGFTVAG